MIESLKDIYFRITFMKAFVLALMLLGVYTVNAATTPFGSETLHSLDRSDQDFATELNDVNLSPRGSDDDAGSKGKPMGRVERRGIALLKPHHVAIDVDRAKKFDPTAHVSNLESSIESFAKVNPNNYFDRDEYLTQHIKEMREDEKRYKSGERICRVCNASWLGIGGISTAASLIVSAIGATEYMNPQLSNVLGVVFGIISGGCMWAANQSKKASTEYHKEAGTIQKSLGVPDRWIDPEVDLGLEPFKLNGRSAPVN